MPAICSFVQPGKGPLRVVVLADCEHPSDSKVRLDLQRAGFVVITIGGTQVIEPYIRVLLPDIVILDAALPLAASLKIARKLRLRNREMAIIMLAEQNGKPDHRSCLSASVDEWFSRSLDPEVLAAKLRSVVREHRAEKSTRGPRWQLEAKGWRLRSPSGAMVDLGKFERRLLSTLLGKQNQTISRNKLIEVLTENTHGFDSHRLDALIHRLRKKVQKVICEVLPLKAVYGEGYVFLFE